MSSFQSVGIEGFHCIQMTLIIGGLGWRVGLEGWVGGLDWRVGLEV